MRTKNEEKWLSHYKALRCYLEANHQLPDKKKGRKPRTPQLVEV